MRITLVISSLNAGGAERVLSNLANYWAAQENQVTLITLESPQVEPFYLLDPQINLIRLGLFSKAKTSLGRVFEIARRLIIIRKNIKKLSPDVVISFVDIMNITTLISCLGLPFPIIVSERTHPRYYAIPAFYNKLRRLFYPRARKVIIQTQSAADYFVNLNNISIIPNSVHATSITTQSHPKVDNIISVGRLVVSKSFEALIYAFSKITKFYPELTLTIYGEGPERCNLTRLISKHNLENKVFLPGAVKNVQEKFVKADLFVFPSRFEGFPNALCEAMAVGLPVIASDCSGNIDVIDDGVNGRLFPVGDVDRLVELIRELLEDSEQRQRLAAEARKITDQFSESKIYQMWNNIIQEIIE